MNTAPCNLSAVFVGYLVMVRAAWHAVIVSNGHAGILFGDGTFWHFAFLSNATRPPTSVGRWARVVDRLAGQASTGAASAVVFRCLRSLPWNLMVV